MLPLNMYSKLDERKKADSINSSHVLRIKHREEGGYDIFSTSLSFPCICANCPESKLVFVFSILFVSLKLFGEFSRNKVSKYFQIQHF